MTLMGVFEGLWRGVEAVLVTLSSDTLVARPVSHDDGDNPWLEYSFEIDGKTYKNSHRIGREELARCLELDAVKVEYSRQFPRFSRLEKPSLLGLVGIVLGYSLLCIVLMVLGFRGALLMMMAGMNGSKPNWALRIRLPSRAG